MSRNTFTGTQTIVNSHLEESQTQNKVSARLRTARANFYAYLLCEWCSQVLQLRNYF